jgi:hypothetical protein
MFMISAGDVHQWVLSAALLTGTALVGGCGGPDQVSTTDRTVTTTSAPAPAYPTMPPATSTTTTTHSEQPSQ